LVVLLNFSNSLETALPRVAAMVHTNAALYATFVSAALSDAAGDPSARHYRGADFGSRAAADDEHPCVDMG